MTSRHETCPHCFNKIFIDSRITSRVLKTSPTATPPKYPWLKSKGRIKEQHVDDVRRWLLDTELAGRQATGDVYNDYTRAMNARQVEPLSHVSLVTVLDELGVKRHRTAAGSIITIPAREVDPPPWEQ